MDLELVKKLIDLIGESDVDEVSIEEGDFKIKIKKRPDVQSEPPVIQYQVPEQQKVQGPAASAQQPGEAGAGQAGGSEASEDSDGRSEEHTSELQSRGHLVCRLLLEKKN